MGWERGGMRASQGCSANTLPSSGSSGCLWLETLPGYPRGGNAAFGEWGSVLSKKTNIFLCLFSMLIE